MLKKKEMNAFKHINLIWVGGWVGGWEGDNFTTTLLFWKFLKLGIL